MTFTVRSSLVGSHVAARLSLSICLLCVFSGCGPSGPRLYDIPGSVMVDGKPAVGATLMFHPNDKANKWVSTANVEASGSFKIITDTRPGIPAGQYKVTLTWPDPAKTPPPGTFAGGSPEDPPDLLNGAYASLAQSNLTASVSGDLKELPPIEIKTK